MNKRFNINYSFYIGLFFVSILIFLALFGPWIAPHYISETFETQYSNGKVYAPPLEPFESLHYPFGTDKWGYDLYSMILYGIRYTIFISILVTILKMIIGTCMGLYIGTWKKTPSWIVAFENAWSYIPLFIILYFFLMPISFNSILEPKFLIAYFIVVTAVLSIPSILSSVRLKTSEINKSDFIYAAKTLGAGKHRIIWKHIFPQLKETLLVMFILEIIHVITLMGQLALFSIFVGGTRVSYDPIIYHSITKELAGLVGQARGNIYGTTHVLYVPLFVLLLTTISFNLLASGLKNRLQANYQRTPWIKTGLEPKLMPKRKNTKYKKGGLSIKIETLFYTLLILFFVIGGSYVFITKDNGIGVSNDNMAKYNLSFEMDSLGRFNAEADIIVKNIGTDDWDKLVFYMIPNVFTKGHHFENIGGYGEFNINHTTINGKKVKHNIKMDRLEIMLPDQMHQGDKVKVHVDYSFTLPEKGYRFSKVGQQYYLAQWYPMLATYRDGKWNHEEYLANLESYHTDFADYNISYSIPKGYSIVTSSDHDPKLAEEHEGTLKVRNVRDFFVAIIQNMNVYTKEVNGVTIRLFCKDEHQQKANKALDLASSSLNFYQKNVGDYPHKQLDIILDEGTSMEYPGVVTINSNINDQSFFDISIVHEVAHQYFYGVISNDPYHEAWLDEGITEFATSMYYYIEEEQPDEKALELSYNRMEQLEQKGLGRKVSNLPIDQYGSVAYVYGQPAIKIYELIQNRYMIKGDDQKEVIKTFLKDYYHHFRYKEVDTEEFIRFMKNYFNVPSGYFSDWLKI